MQSNERQARALPPILSPPDFITQISAKCAPILRLQHISTLSADDSRRALSGPRGASLDRHRAHGTHWVRNLISRSPQYGVGRPSAGGWRLAGWRLRYGTGGPGSGLGTGTGLAARAADQCSEIPRIACKTTCFQQNIGAFFSKRHIYLPSIYDKF